MTLNDESEKTIVYKVVRVEEGKLLSCFARHPSIRVEYIPNKVVEGKAGTPLMAFDDRERALTFAAENGGFGAFRVWAAEATGVRPVFLLSHINPLTTAGTLVTWWMERGFGLLNGYRVELLQWNHERATPPGSVACSSIKLTEEIFDNPYGE